MGEKRSEDLIKPIVAPRTVQRVDLTRAQTQVVNPTLGTEAAVNEIQTIDNSDHVGNVGNDDGVLGADDNRCEHDRGTVQVCKLGRSPIWWPSRSGPGDQLEGGTEDKDPLQSIQRTGGDRGSSGTRTPAQIYGKLLF